MSKGRFDAPKNGRQSVKGTDPYAVKNKPQTRGGAYAAKQSTGTKLWPILAAVAGLAVVVVGVLLFIKLSKGGGPETVSTQPSTTELKGMTRAELDQKASAR